MNFLIKNNIDVLSMALIWSVNAKACPANLNFVDLPLIVAPPNSLNQLTLTSEGDLNCYFFDGSAQNFSGAGERLEKYISRKSVCNKDSTSGGSMNIRM